MEEEAFCPGCGADLRSIAEDHDDVSNSALEGAISLHGHPDRPDFEGHFTCPACGGMIHLRGTIEEATRD